MNQCIRCDGTGIETFWDGRWERHTCYHCSGTGTVDDDMSFHDKLMSIARTLAYEHVSSMKRAADNDPDGEGWELYAAENMMTGRDYFDLRVEEYTAYYADQLAAMRKEKQDMLVAWAEKPVTDMMVDVPEPSPSYVHLNAEVWDHSSEDDLSF